MAAEGKSEEEKRVSGGEQWGLFLTGRERPQTALLLLSVGACKRCWNGGLSHREGGNHDLASVTSAPQLFTAKLQLRHNRCHSRILIVLHDYK